MLWREPEPQTNLYRIGVTESFIESLPGGVVGIELLPTGTQVNPGDGFGFIHAGERTLDLRTPWSMELLEANAAVLNDPRLITASPQLRGWLAPVRLLRA